MVEKNPFLGPEWVPLARVITTFLNKSEPGTFHLNTYGLKYSMDPHRSPYIQARWDDFGELQLEASGNLICDPQLTEDQFREMEFLGWTRPDVTPDEYQEGGHGEVNPNFVRYFTEDDDLEVVADFFLTTLITVYGIQATDYFNFGEFSIPDRVAALGGLIRLKADEGNRFGSIFGLIIER